MFRYDNTAHHDTRTFPHYRHTPKGIEDSKERELPEVLDEIEKMV
ncbi:MAG: DUF6516 family protein [Dehalococcoidia bacterium]